MEILRLIADVPWKPHVGDPTPLAWLTVAAYLAAALGCGACAAKAARIFERRHIRLHQTIWWGMCAIMLFLGVNKQLGISRKQIIGIVRPFSDLPFFSSSK